MSNSLSKYLKNLDVQKIYFGAGARNSSLISKLDEFQSEFILNEEQAAFMALGEAKLSRKPVVVCTTSGTAVAQCLPAIIEAFYSNIPLIILSADRPKRLRFSHAPQAIDQTQIFDGFIRSFYTGKLEDFDLTTGEYPMQINIEIDDSSFNQSIILQTLNTNRAQSILNDYEKPILIITEGAKLNIDQIRMFDEKNYRIYIECTSQFHALDLRNRIRLENTVLDLIEKKDIDLVIKDGMTPISKLWRELDRTYPNIPVISYQNEKTGLGRGFLLYEIPSELHSKDYKELKEKNIGDYISKYPEGELAYYSKIHDLLNEDDIVYVGNSMAVRYWQMISSGNNLVYASRGANGIDGQISTAIGMAKVSSKHVHCILGDLTFQYDIATLLNDVPKNISFHIINNKGGRIFQRVAVDKKMILEHEKSLRSSIQSFKLENNVIEYFPDNEQTEQFWESYNA